MENFLIVVQVIAFAAITTLCVYLITVLVRVKNILAIVENDIKEVSAKTIPVLNNLEAITDKFRSITESIDEQVELVKTSIQSIKEIADNIVSFERRVQEKMEEPVLEAVGTLAAIVKGFKTFYTRLRG